MRSINAYLCPGCAQMLKPWLNVEPADAGGEKSTCDWCERAQTDYQYRIRITADE